MQLDVVIPTYNRSRLLRKALRSLLDARVPPGLDVRITVVDNNSKDDTQGSYITDRPRANGRISYVFEKRQGRSPALNAGVAATSGISCRLYRRRRRDRASWYEVVLSAFAEHELDFIGGPYVPRFESELPAWLPSEYNSVIGVVDGGTKRVPFDRNYPGILMGGNAVFTTRDPREGGALLDFSRSQRKHVCCRAKTKKCTSVY